MTRSVNDNESMMSSSLKPLGQIKKYDGPRQLADPKTFF